MRFTAATPTGLLIVALTATPGAAQDCGYCNNPSQAQCSDYGYTYPCHVWVYIESGIYNRGDDDHFGGPGYWMATGTCQDEHPTGCNFLAAGSQWSSALTKALRGTDVEDLSTLLAAEPSVWLEYNHQRGAVQVLVESTCDGLDEDKVLANVKVRNSRELATLARLLPQQERIAISTQSTIQTPD